MGHESNIIGKCIAPNHNYKLDNPIAVTPGPVILNSSKLQPIDNMYPGLDWSALARLVGGAVLGLCTQPPAQSGFNSINISICI